MTSRLSLASKHKINAICDAFEESWQATEAPVIEDYLAQVPDAERPTLFVELLRIDMELGRANEQSTIRAYLDRFPNYASEIVSAWRRSGYTTEPQPTTHTLDHTSAVAQATCRIGDSIGRYTVLGLLGRGSFGEVYLVRDEPCDSLCAIKLLREGCLGNATALRNFVSEGRLAIQLSANRGLVSTYDVGTLADGTPYLVMEYVEGATLLELIHTRELSHESAAELIACIGETIAWLHEQGVYHRDLKPSNILVGRDGQPKVADLGVALRVATQRSRPGEYAGTPRYMSPEQVRSETHLLDGRTDLWALGVIFYELLTGQCPFDGATKRQVEEEILKRDPRPPREIDASIPPEYEAICLGALNKEPTERFATVFDFVQQLRYPESWWADPAAKRLPGFLTWLKLLPSWRRQSLTRSQQRMMRVATARYSRRLLGWTSFSMTLLLAGILLTQHQRTLRKRDYAAGLVRAVLESNLDRLPKVLADIEQTDDGARQELETALKSRSNPNSEAALRLRLALLKTDPVHLAPVYDWMIREDDEQQSTLSRILLRDEYNSDHRDEAVRYLRGQLHKSFRDNIGQHALWPTAPLEVIDELQASSGLLTETFAVTPSLASEDFARLSNELRDAKYAPTVVRPYNEGSQLKVAAIWQRDPRPWQLIFGLLPDQVSQQRERRAADGWQLLDLASYATVEKTKSQLRLCGVWRKGHERDSAREFCVAANANEYHSRAAKLRQAGRVHAAFTAASGTGGERLLCGVWQTKEVQSMNSPFVIDEVEPDYFSDLPGLRSTTTYTLSQVPPNNMRYANQLKTAEQVLSRFPTNAAARLLQGRALFYLSRDDEAVESLTAAIANLPEYELYALPYRLQAAARLGDMSTANSDLDAYRRLLIESGANNNWRTAHIASLECLVAIFAGNTDDALAKLESHIRTNEYSETIFWGAVSYCAAANHIRSGDPHRAKKLVEHAATLMYRAREMGFDFGDRMLVTPELELLRALADFIPLEGQVVAHAAVWDVSQASEAKELRGNDLQLLKDNFLDLALQGYEPQSVAAVATQAPQRSRFSAVWRQPVPSPTRGAEAARRASAAAALWKLGEPDPALALLREREAPQIRSHLIDRLATFGVSASDVSSQLLALDTEPGVQQGLLLALGNYDSELGPERLRLANALRQAFRQADDPGVHAACCWLLQRWGDASSMPDDVSRVDVTDGFGDHKWWTDDRGHTFVVVDGPVEFAIGSPAHSPFHRASEPQSVRRIPYSFAVSDAETTIGQLRQWNAEVDRVDANSPEEMPAGTDWQTAARYCNWLSERDGLPVDQWCYDPDGTKQLRAVPAAWERSGYRLPREIEWEYACRAGTTTSWLHGENTSLLDGYAWSYENSGHRPHPVRQLRPNRFGLFDIAGNLLEWCHGDSDAPVDNGTGANRLARRAAKHVARGGSFALSYRHGRSAARVSLPSTNRQQVGFRVVRTLPKN